MIISTYLRLYSDFLVENRLNGSNRGDSKSRQSNEARDNEASQTGMMTGKIFDSSEILGSKTGLFCD
jgi:hypothetical protein